MSHDTPEAARQRGKRRIGNTIYTRQEPVEEKIEGKEVTVDFNEKRPGHRPKGRLVVIEASQGQASHMEGKRNPLFFIDEAQPKDRTDAESILAEQKHAGEMDPALITDSRDMVDPFRGAPTVNLRGETIQGNHRMATLRYMYANEPASQKRYREYLHEHASDFGFTPEQAKAIASMKEPILVNMVDVDDAMAIELGQDTGTSRETGGKDRIDAERLAVGIGDKMGRFMDTLLTDESEDGESLRSLIRRNGLAALKYLRDMGKIDDRQYATAIDKDGNLSDEGLADLEKFIKRSFFAGESREFEEMFDALPAKAQSAILAQIWRDSRTAEADKLTPHVKEAVKAFYAMLSIPQFKEARNFSDALMAAEAWRAQTEFNDDGDTVSNLNRHSNFAIRFAALMKGGSMKETRAILKQMLDWMQGTAEQGAISFDEEEPEAQPGEDRTFRGAVRKVLEMEYQPGKASPVMTDEVTNGDKKALDKKDKKSDNVKTETEDGNGENGGADVAGHGEAGTTRKRGGRGDDRGGKRAENGERASEPGGRAGNVEEDHRAGFLDAVRTLYEKGKATATRLFGRSFFDVVKTPDFMKDLGLSGDRFTIRYGVISRHFGKDAEHDLPLELWERLPEALSEPFAITKYYTDKERKHQKGYRLYTSLRMPNGSYVVVSAEVKNVGRNLEVNAINTIFGRNSLSEAQDELIYTSKKITPEQQSLLDGNNPHQYPAGRESSEDKQGKGAESSQKQPIRPEDRSEWITLDGKQRLEIVTADPLTVDEINGSGADQITKFNALSFLKGKRGSVQEVSYLKIYEDVRYSDGDTSANSGTKDASQLAGTDTTESEGRGVRGEDGGGSVPMDRGDHPSDISGKRNDLEDSERGSDTDSGEGGNSSVSGSASGVEGLSSGGGRRKGGRKDRGTRSDGRSSGGERGGAASRNDGSGDAETRSGQDNRLRGAIDAFKDELDDFIRAGRDSLSLSVVGMSAKQIELLPRVILAGAKVGYELLRAGIRRFSEWSVQMRELIGKHLKNAGFSDAEIDEWIREMWDCGFEVDNDVKPISEWASILGQEQLRAKVRMTLDEKRAAQKEAERIGVKFGNIENIRATLPFLLPSQQEDVLKAETQFFDESHADAEHGNGKGFMFTNGTGTGKTYTGLGIVKRFVKEGKERVLILTPSQPKVNDWINDGKNLGLNLRSLDDWASEHGTTATTEAGEGPIVTTYANFRQNEALLKGTFDLIVYDESHRLLENKKGVSTSGALQHYKISNRDNSYAYLRLQSVNPVWREIQAKSEEFQARYTELAERVKRDTGKDNLFDLKVNQLIPPFFNEEWSKGIEARFPQFAKLRNEILGLRERFEKEEKPKLEKEAGEAAGRTKVVFLSATPFNTRENIDYTEGYIFSYPKDTNDRMSGRTRFFLDHFGSAYKYRYHRLESSVSNPAAVAAQEIEFSDYLQNTLGTMSGRVIDSEYDYSRDFPTVTGDYASRFNEAISAFYKSEALRSACADIMGNYIYSSALFESMKVNQVIPRIEEHLKKGRKVVVFHRRVETTTPLAKPFESIFDLAKKNASEERDIEKRKRYLSEISSMKRKFRDMLEWEKSLDLSMPRAQLAKHFGKNNILFFSGKETSKQKNDAIKEFNDDKSGKNILVVQESSGKEGISLHDRTGEHQRVLISLALPQSPITALQIEGRIFRIGNRSNAIFEYPLLGLDSEMILFGQKFNTQVGTTENLALGSKARNLRESFTRGIEERSGRIDPETQGLGGKEFDSPNNTEIDEFERSVLDFYSNNKLAGKRDSREGIDYYPTPEPLGYMMSQWGHIGDGESVLEPSAGHGAIARYVPLENSLTAIEPSTGLFSKLQLKAGGLGRKFENTIFENYNVINKHDVVLMNPPFGTGGRMAVDHVAKAFSHLEEGGRIVAIIPRGSTDKKFDKWYETTRDAVVTGEILLPDITFQNAGTTVMTRVLVIDKITDEKLQHQAESKRRNFDLSHERYAKIEDFFNAIRYIEMPERTIDRKARMRKKCAQAARELRKLVGEDSVRLTDSGITVTGRGVWEMLEWGNRSGKELTEYLQTSFKNYTSWMQQADSRGKDKNVAVYAELRELTAKLGGMSVEQMEHELGLNKQQALQYGQDEQIYRGTDFTGDVNLSHEERGVYQPGLFDDTDSGDMMASRVRFTTPSLFDFDYGGEVETDKETRRLQEEAERRADEANGHIDAFLESASDVMDRYSLYAESHPEMRDIILERMDEELEALNDVLRNQLQMYYLDEGNTEHDAQQMARDMAARVNAQLHLSERFPAGEEFTASGDKQGDAAEEELENAEAPAGRNRMVTAGGETVNFTNVRIEDETAQGLEATEEMPFRKLEPGEFCHVERKFTETQEFGFTGSERIGSLDDVAYIFRSLEDYSIENTFAVLVKDGRPLIVHLGMGSPTASMIDSSAIRGAMDAYGAQEIYFVHNHPSGNLRPSPQDINIHRSISAMAGADIEVGSIIIDVTSGRYSTFDEHGMERHDREDSGRKDDRDIPVVRMSRAERSREGKDVENLSVIRSSEDVARFVSEKRLGNGDKISYLLLAQNNSVIGNLHTSFTSYGEDVEALAEEMVRMGVRHGAKTLVPYGNVEISGSELRRLNEAVKRLSSGDGIGNMGLRLLDALRIESRGDGRYMSAMDEGMAFEPEGRINSINDEFNSQLQQYLSGNLPKQHVLTLGLPMGVMKNFLPNIPVVMRQRILNKASETKHNVALSELKDLPLFLSAPIFVFKRDENTIGVLTEIKDRDGKNVCIAIEINRTIQYGKEYLQVNDIRSVHGRDAENIILPIVYNSTLSYVDKEKGLAWLSSASSNYQQEIAKQDLDSAAKIVKNFENPRLPEEKMLERQGDGGFTDEEDAANDPWEMPFGESMRWKRRQKEAAERMREEMRERVSSLTEGTGTEVTILEDASGLNGRKRTAKGWFDPRTGKIVMVLGNHSSTADAEATVLHEMVGHKGLRDLFGDKFEAFLDAVYANADNDVKERIDVLATRNGWNRRTATEEYMAGLAEDGSFRDIRRGWWQKLRGLFMDFLRSCGFSGDVKISDNELRYVLWMSYENLREPGRFSGILGEAARVTKEAELGVGEFSEEAMRHSEGDGKATWKERAQALTDTKRAFEKETDYAQKDSPRPAPKDTWLTSTDSKAEAKVAKISENLKRLEEKINSGSLGVNEMIFSLAQTLGIKHPTSGKSNYAEIEVHGVGATTIRISNHSAEPTNFGRTGNNVGIVIKTGNHRFRPNGGIDYVELMYYGDKVAGNTELQKSLISGSLTLSVKKII